MNMIRNLKKVLYFIAGPVPNDAEREDAEQYYNGKSTVAFRNASKVNKDEAIEAFDIVAGRVPANYAAAALEKGEDALQAAPIVDAASVPPGSPLAGKDAAGAGKDAGKPKAAPKPPEPKPGAGWKPNA
jgi:hypothetical protein